MDHFTRLVATVDLPVADHRRSPDRARNTVLYTVHTDQSVHHFRHGHCRLLRTGDCDVFPVFPYIQRDEKETKRLAEPASHEQATQVRPQKTAHEIRLIRRWIDVWTGREAMVSRGELSTKRQNYRVRMLMGFASFWEHRKRCFPS